MLKAFYESSNKQRLTLQFEKAGSLLTVPDNGHCGRAWRLLDTGLVVSTRVLKRKPGRFAACRHNEGGCMQDRIYTPGALYVARASTGTKRNAPLMEVSRM